MMTPYMLFNLRLCSVLSVVLALAVVVNDAYGGWGPQGCATVVAPAAEYSGWRYLPEYKQSILYEQGIVVAGWDHEAKVYRTCAGGRWSEPLPAPWAKAKEGCPCGCACTVCDCASEGPCCSACQCVDDPFKKTAVGAAPKVDLLKNPGVMKNHVPQTESYNLNGKKVSKQQAFEAFGSDLPADGQWSRLLFIGGETAKKAYDDWLASPEWSKLKGSMLCQFRKGDSWDVNNVGRRKGECEISLERPGGKQECLQGTYQGAPALAAAVDKYGGVRKPDAQYDPAKAPDPTKLVMGGVPLWLILAGGLILIFFLRGDNAGS